MFFPELKKKRAQYLAEEQDKTSVWFGLVRFYGISTTAGYLMPNSVYSYIYIWFVNIFCR